MGSYVTYAAGSLIGTPVRWPFSGVVRILPLLLLPRQNRFPLEGRELYSSVLRSYGAA